MPCFPCLLFSSTTVDDSVRVTPSLPPSRDAQEDTDQMPNTQSRLRPREECGSEAVGVGSRRAVSAFRVG